MASPSTTTVEVDSELLARLRGVQERNTLSEEEAITLGVRAVHEARRWDELSARAAALRARQSEAVDAVSLVHEGRAGGD